MVAKLKNGNIAIFQIDSHSDKAIRIVKKENRKKSFYKVQLSQFTIMRKWINKNFDVAEFIR